MKSAKGKVEDEVDVKVELKYCERCGALGVRECGAGAVYCDGCLIEVAQLPPPKKRPGRLILPVQPHSVIEGYELEEDELKDLEGTGGAA
jgi:hypothetical protein